MTEAVSVARPKDPRFVEAGRKAMRARWGPPRVVRLDALDPSVANAVVALVRAAESTKEAAGEGAPTAQEVRRAGATTPTG